jgi:hypothetical protein
MFLLYAGVSFSQPSCSKALYLDGSEVAAFIEPITLESDFTLEFWVKIDGTADANDRLLAGKQYHLFFEFGDLRLADNNNVTILKTQGISFSNTWRHVALVRQSGLLKLYIDGNSHTQLPWQWNNTLEINLIGRSLGKEGFFSGWFDELRCWNQARTQTELQTWKNRRISPSNSAYNNLIAYFRFNYAKDAYTRGFSNQNRWLKLPNDDAIETLWNQAAFIDTCGQAPTVSGNLSISAMNNCSLALPIETMLQDAESSLDLHDIEIVSSPQQGFLTDDRPDLVTLTVFFQWGPSNVTVEKAPLRFNKDFAFSLTFDDGPISVKEKVIPIVEGGMTNTGIFHNPKYSRSRKRCLLEHGYSVE